MHHSPSVRMHPAPSAHHVGYPTPPDAHAGNQRSVDRLDRSIGSTGAPGPVTTTPGAPLAKENILKLLDEHEERVLRPQVERAVERAKQIILEGANIGQRRFDFVVCRRDKDEVDDVWQRRQLMIWNGLSEQGLRDFSLRAETLDRGREGLYVSVTY
eukprot:Hpha_TRINITY_DN28231_c0_g1::TRINITY_DN28231_c0_g1_i1::g.116787::m.116787